jgi:hypothetical protein
MADDILLSSGSGGDTIAADDIGPGVKYQRVKMTLGADNTNDGDVASGNPMPCNLLEIGDTAVLDGTGSAAAGALRVVIAGEGHDDPDAGDPVKIGGRAVTTLPAAVSLTNDRVDQLYTTQGQLLVGGVDGTTPRGIAVNASGQLEVDISAQQLSPVVVDGTGGSFPVTGTVTANAGTNLNTSALALDASLPAFATDAAAHGASQEGYRAMGTDGTNDQQLSCDSTGAVNITGQLAAGHTVAQTGAPWEVDGNKTSDGAAPGTDNVGALTAIATAAAPSYTEGRLAGLSTDLAGTLRADITKVGNTAVSTNDGVSNAGTLRVTVSNDSDGRIGLNPLTSGGWLVQRDLDLDEATPANIKSSAGQVGGWYIYNNATSVRYVKLYDKASAPVLATDTPEMTIPIPASSAANVEFANGIEFTLGIGWAATTGVADADTGAPAANDVVANLLYK